MSLASRGSGKGKEAELWLRPEMLEICDSAAPGTPFTGALLSARFSGPVSYLTVRLDSGVEIEVMVTGEIPAPRAQVGLRLRADARPKLFAPAFVEGPSA